MSAVWALVPAVKAAVATGVVDPDRVGLHGHSWGGYQTAFTITQTDTFAAAIAGAPLTNMISMYAIIYKNTGGTNGAIFEASQGRFTSGPWDNWEAYTRNSPVAHAKDVTTPLMMLHNDEDGAVDFTQGVEYFNTLRRLHKPVILLEYPGENHGLRRPANQQDYTERMKEYFDHHLKGTEAPEWLEYGIPRLEMQKHIDERLKRRQEKEQAAPGAGGGGGAR
jgi:dipeptidyl aminopeptidase/acylaminoacyl peptidase